MTASQRHVLRSILIVLAGIVAFMLFASCPTQAPFINTLF
jgi:hypothetical protein